ncbi:hypothetical protein STEG23_016281 [Scotinomys teguina]
MLHRAKYSRFRNESITSLDEGSPGGSVGNKGSSPPPHPALAPHLPAEDATVPTQESPTALCTLIPRMASMKLANPVTFLSLKAFCLGTKEVPRLKLQESQDQAPGTSASPETSLNRTGPAPTPHPDQNLLSDPSEQYATVFVTIAVMKQHDQKKSSLARRSSSYSTAPQLCSLLLSHLLRTSLHSG